MASGMDTLVTLATGNTLTVPPASFGSGTNWTTASSTPLPLGIKEIWINITPGTTCTLQVDAGGATAVPFANVQAGWWPVPSGINITNIYAAANGSTGLVISAVVS